MTRQIIVGGVPIGGGAGFPSTQRARVQWVDGHARTLPTERVDRLLSRYGTVATDVIEAILADPDDRPLDGAPQYSTAELRHLAASEDVRHLDDVLLRRTSLAFVGAVTPDAAREVAETIAPVLGWDAERTAHETERGLAAVRAAEPAAQSEETPWPTM